MVTASESGKSPENPGKKPPDRESLARNIAWFVRTRRDELGLTLKGLAEKSGLSRVTIGSYEGAKALPGALELVRLAWALETDVERLLASPETTKTGPEDSRPGMRVSPTANLSIPDESLVERIRAAATHLLRVEELAGYMPNSALQENRTEAPRPFGPGTLRQMADGLRKRPGMGLGNLASARLAEAAGATCAFVAPNFGIGDAFGLFFGDRPIILIREPDHSQGCVEAAIQGVYRELGHLILHAGDFAAPRVSPRRRRETPLQTSQEANFFAEVLTVPTETLHRIWREENLARLDPLSLVVVLKDFFCCRFTVVLRRLLREHLTNLMPKDPSHGPRPGRDLIRKMERLAIEQADRPPWKGEGIPDPACSLMAREYRHEPYALAPWRLETSCRTDRLLALACRKDPSILAGVAALGYGPGRIRSLEDQWLASLGREVPPQSP